MLALERRLEEEGVFELVERVDRLSTDDVGAKGLLQCVLLRLDNVVDAMGFPQLIRLDVEDVLEDAGVLAQFQLVLIREQAHLGLTAVATSWNHGSRLVASLAATVVARSLRSLPRVGLLMLGRGLAGLGSLREATT